MLSREQLDELSRSARGNHGSLFLMQQLRTAGILLAISCNHSTAGLGGLAGSGCPCWENMDAQY